MVRVFELLLQYLVEVCVFLITYPRRRMVSALRGEVYCLVTYVRLV